MTEPKAKAFRSEHMGGEIAVGLQFGPDPTGDTVEVDYDFDGDGKLYLAFAGGFNDATAVSPKQLRRFALDLIDIAARSEMKND